MCVYPMYVPYKSQMIVIFHPSFAKSSNRPATKSTMTLPGFIAITASLVISNGEGLARGMQKLGYGAGI